MVANALSSISDALAFTAWAAITIRSKRMVNLFATVSGSRYGDPTTGDILTVAGGVPTWAPPAGGGKVFQVINATYSTQTNSSSTTFADTGLTATITPTSATSKILVFANIAGIIKTDQNTSTGGIYNLMRGATQIVADFGGVAGFNNVSQFNYVGGAALTYLDNPATTSATTYKVQFKNNAGLNQIGVQGNSASSSITLMEIGA